jgi:hypothetical protein
MHCLIAAVLSEHRDANVALPQDPPWPTDQPSTGVDHGLGHAVDLVSSFPQIPPIE